MMRLFGSHHGMSKETIVHTVVGGSNYSFSSGGINEDVHMGRRAWLAPVGRYISLTNVTVIFTTASVSCYIASDD